MTMIVQVSDLHLLGGGQRLKGYDTTARFRFCLSDIFSKTPPDQELHIIVTGDIAHDELEETYREFSLLNTRNQTFWYCIPGNHDTPKFIHDAFPGTSANPDTGGARVSCGHEVDLILLSSHVPGEVHGALSEDQQELIRTPIGRPAMVALHHPPVSVNDPIFDAMGLREAEQFWHSVSENSDIVGVIFGHAHRSFEHNQEVGSRLVPAWCCPSTCFQYGMNDDHTYGMDTSRIGYRWIHFDPERGLDSEVVWLPFSETS